MIEPYDEDRAIEAKRRAATRPLVFQPLELHGDVAATALWFYNRQVGATPPAMIIEGELDQPGYWYTTYEKVPFGGEN